MIVEYRDQDDNKVWRKEAKSISHFHIERDYLIHLQDGTIELSADLVKEITRHELKEERYERIKGGRADTS